jgi:hypothetical protein
MKCDIGEAFEKLKSSMFIKYKGCTIIIETTHYIWNGETYYYLDSAKEAIDQTIGSLQKSFDKR